MAQIAQQSNLANGIPQLAARIAEQKPAEAGFYLELGQAWLSARKPASAIAPCRKPSVEPRSLLWRQLALADALTQTHQPGRAIEILNQAIKATSDDPLLWYQLALAHSGAGREREKIAALEKSVSLDPDLTEPRNLLGAAYAMAGDLDRAKNEFLTALRINPDSPEALGNMGHLLAATGDPVEAAFYFARSVQLKPNDGEVRTNYAVVLARLNQFAEARQQIDAAIKLDPKSPEAQYPRAACWNVPGTQMTR